MSSEFALKPASDEEVAAISKTISIPRLDSAALRERLSAAAALLAALPAPPPGPSLVHEIGADSPPAIIPLANEVVVGRRVAGVGCIPDCRELSRRHFRVTSDAGFFVLEDLDSSNGTMIDGIADPIKRRILRDGDFILAGGKVFLFVDPDAD